MSEYRLEDRETTTQIIESETAVLLGAASVYRTVDGQVPYWDPESDYDASASVIIPV